MKKDSTNLRLLRDIHLNLVAVEMFGPDTIYKELESVQDTVVPCGAPASRYCRVVRFGEHTIPPSIDYLRVHISLTYPDSTSTISRDTVVTMFRADDKHTGFIDH